MKVVVDDKIPYIKEAICRIADEVIFLPGKEISAEAVSDADALIIRTRTRCDHNLLNGSCVQFIATATIGYDHIDIEYCRRSGIQWTNAPGCNSASVAQYLHSSLLLLQREKGLKLAEATLGIVGVGNVGSKVADVAKELGMKVMLNDPVREAAEGNKGFSSLEEIAEQCDVITFHVPLNKEGIYRTFHLADTNFFHLLKRRPYFINTARGEVVDTEALLQALDKGVVADAIIDVWENEPNINHSLLNKVYIATPHIAGYSADGKANATRMSLDALCRHFNIQAEYLIDPPAPPSPLVPSNDATDLFLQIYDPRRDSQSLKEHPEHFEQLRGNYPLRRERTAYNIML
ncbi:MAG: 4-phosphoerythronate dehydrogenase PdxB [Mediterranea massiliensis]|nr:4-phosphoerythronate dehydrogenase PdxB [Mediterranea massiliensis]